MVDPIPDFSFKQTFPIASIMEAMQRKAQLEQQNKLEQQQQLQQGLQSIGQVGQTLVDKRLQVAKALAIGRHFGYPDEISKNMTADEVLKAAAVDKGMIDSDWLRTAFQRSFGGIPGNPVAPTSNPVQPTPQLASGGAMLTGGTPTITPVPATPQPAQASPAPATAPVPITAPSSQPKMVNPATFNAAMKFAGANKIEPVVTRSQAEAQGGVSHGTHILPDQLEVSEKKDQFMQREWDKLLKESDPLNASSRTPLGLASRATFQANRALKTLSNPVVTNQEAGNAMADIAAIYQNGSPTQFGMSHQEYTTAYGKVQGILQAISGKPQDALPDAIKNRLVSVLTDMKATNSALLKQRLDMTERSKKAVINHFPQEWKEYREILEGDQGGYNGLGAAGTQSTGLPQVGDAYNGGKVLSIKRIK